MTRFHLCAAWLAIVALLIDGLLPSAVSAAARPDAAAAAALCGVAAGTPLPGKAAPTLPTRHCALCAGAFAALPPSRQGGTAARLRAGDAHPAIALSRALETRLAAYAAAQPRAPPRAA